MQVRNVPDVMLDGRWVRTYRLDGVKYHTMASCLWGAINERTKKQKAYQGVEIHFKDFQAFATWCNAQYGYACVDQNGELWHLDKDLLGTHYAPETCLFIPKSINNLIKDEGCGVRQKGLRYYARDTSFGKEKYLGSFDTWREADRVVKHAKHRHLQKIIESEEFAAHTRMIEGLKQFKEGWKND